MNRTPATYLLGVALISCASLGLEVLLVRLISILLYPVATYLVISLALLGIGVSGGVLALRPKVAVHPGAMAVGFSLSALVSLAMIWGASDIGVYAALLPLVLAGPFFFAGCALALALSTPTTDIHRVYFADLVGAALGGGASFVLLQTAGGLQAGLVLAALGLASAFAFLQGRGVARLAGASAAGLLAAALWLPVPRSLVPVALKELALATRLGPDIRWEYQGWSALSRVDVVSFADDRLNAASPVRYKLVTQDGGAPSLLLNFRNEEERRQFFDRAIFGLPYWIRPNPRVLIIGLGGGPDVQAALTFGARRVQAVEISPGMVDIVADEFASFTGAPYADPRVEITLADGRHYLERSPDVFDLIQLTGVDASVASVGGNPNLAENFLYTVEAFQAYLEHLAPDGLISVSFPNVEGLGLRLLGLAHEALLREGIAEPEPHLVVILVEGYVGVLIKASPFEAAEVAALQERVESGATSVYFPLYHRLFGSPPSGFFSERRLLVGSGIRAEGTYADFLQAAREGQASEYLAARPQNNVPPTDDSPFFFVLDKWGARAPNLQVLVWTVGILTFAGVVLILLPVAWNARRRRTLPAAASIALYFLCLGLGFFFIEVNYIQKYSLLLGHPSFALVVVLGALLISSGAGSLVGGRWAAPASRKVTVSTLGVAGIVLGLVIGMDALIRELQPLPLATRLVAAILLAAAPGFFMGIPFPTGLSAVKGTDPAFVPWAWGVNAVASVAATPIALLMAMAAGFRGVFLAAAVLYGLAFAAFRTSARGGGRPVGPNG